MTETRTQSASNVPLSLPVAVLLACLSGLLLVLAFPYARLVGLAFGALVPLDLALRRQGPLRGALIAFVGMLVFNFYLMGWARFFGLPAAGVLAGERNLVWIWFGMMMGAFPSTGPHARALAFACSWTVCEYLRILGPFGCTWGDLSHIFARYPTWIQVNSLLGPWTLSFVLAYCNGALASRSRGPIAAAVLLVAGTLGFGTWRLHAAPPAPRQVRMGIVQPNMGRDVRWHPGYAADSLARLETATLRAGQEGAQVVVWPETSLPYRDFRANPNLTFRIGMLARTAGCHILAGSIEMLHDAGNHTLNTVSVISPEGEFGTRYDKQRLVPGGEYLPWEGQLRRFRIFDAVMRYVPGAGTGIVIATLRPPAPPGDVPAAGEELRMGLLVCFESMVPTLARRRALQGARMLIVPTNDGWFGEDPALDHHFEMAMMRAVETGLPVVQCGNTGISGFVDGFGRLLGRTRENEQTFMTEPVPLDDSLQTLYLRVGDVLPPFLLAQWIFLFVRGRSRISLKEARDRGGD